jgi:hypothetical protein
MITFAEAVFLALVCTLLTHLLLSFLSEDFRIQKYSFRKALDRILSDLKAQAEKGTKHPELSIIHKNREFAIRIALKEVNSHYSTYTIFINGEEAAVYHKLRHCWLCSYFLEEINKRHKMEIISIVRAGARVLRKRDKPKKENTNSYSEYSYFK